MNLSPRQALAFWKLLFTDKEPTMTEFTRPLGVAPKIRGTEERKQMIDAGFIELEKRGRANYVILTDKAWRKAADNFDATISQSKFAADALQALLKRLQIYMRKSNVTLAEIMSPAENVEAEKTEYVQEVKPRPAESSSKPVDSEKNVEIAYYKASGGKWNVRVRLTELRKQLPDVPRTELDTLLLKMQKDEKLVLYPLDYRPEIKPEDEQAAIDIGGYQNHIVYMRG
jgi:hypothetical protein